MNTADSVSAASADFGFRLLRRLAADMPEGNVFFSPLSVSSALCMTLNGVGGPTAAGMSAALGLAGVPLADINAAYGRLLPALTAPDPKITVRIANALWTGRGVALDPAFRARCRESYAARTDALTSAAAINAWISESTEGKITELVSDTDIAGALLVLTNALYFRGLWQTPFDRSNTQPGPFYLSPSVSKPVPLMCLTGMLRYADTALGQAVSLRYGDAGRMSMVVVLPPPERTVDSVAEALAPDTWAHLTAALAPTRLRVFLPRFHAEFAVRLSGPLSALGMTAAFRRSSDFLPMGFPDALLSEVIHKATLDVDEKGAVAAAATAVVMTRGGVPSPPAVTMRVDRPFLAAICDEVTGALLFAGMIRDPA